MSITNGVRYEQEIGELFQGLENVENLITKYNFDVSLYHLVKLRASQINQCAYCVKMHTREAREDGEINNRLDRLIVWEHTSDFDVREKAALAWTEALTYLDKGTDYSSLRLQLREHFSDQEISVLTVIIGMINLWNRIQVSRH